MHKALLAVAALLFVLGACAYTANTRPTPAFDVYSNYGDKLPGHYLLYIEATKLDATIHPAGFECSAHRFPVTMASGFASSVEQTFQNLVGSVETIPEPVTASQLAGRNARGMIVVRGEDIQGRLRLQPGFWTASMETEINIVAGLTVDGRSGRLLGTTVEGSGKGDAPAGFACGGGSKAFEIASEEALKEAVRKLGEALTNSERLRAGT